MHEWNCLPFSLRMTYANATILHIASVLLSNHHHIDAAIGVDTAEHNNGCEISPKTSQEHAVQKARQDHTIQA